MGSEAYGCASNQSDIDVYGVCIPRKMEAFPHLAGEIPDFGNQKQRFGVWQEHHCIDPDSSKEYDFSVYSIIKYFHLAMNASPNIIDSMFVPRRCILHSTEIGEMIRENRKIFLSKKLYHTLKGYAYMQNSKIRNKVNYANEKRAKDIEEFGYSTKYAMHLVRLISECIQILVEHDLDLEKNREQLKSIRRGEWTLEQVENFFVEKEKTLEELYVSSALQLKPDEAKIKALLLNCLEHHYGTLQDAIKMEASTEMVLDDLEKLLIKYRGIK
jgi:predicted nucleotidyltransferase